MEEGASVPLHTHPIEEAWLVTNGALTVRIGDETVVASSESVVRIPPGVPPAVRNDERAEARALFGAPWNRATFFTQVKLPSCAATRVLLHVGHRTFSFSCSEMVMVSSKDFWHFSHMNS